MSNIEDKIKSMDPHSALKYLDSLEESSAKINKLKDKLMKKIAAIEKEHQRFDKMCFFEKQLYESGYNLIAGVDEAGRGPLAGPVVAAAVILPKDIFIENLNDSKKLSEKQREEIYLQIQEKAIAYSVGIVDEKTIDNINILNATKHAMKAAIQSLKVQPEFLLIDALEIDDIPIEQWNIEKGDSLSISIAAASIIAKVTRDHMIVELDKKYPQYGFAKHKGYGTAEHINAIKKFGICPIHRISFTKKFIT